MKRAIIALLATVVGAYSLGCDTVASSGPLPSGLDELAVMARGLQSGDAIMDQVQQRDRLQDGTGVNCPNTGAGSGQRGAGQGDGDRLRLRDGSCGL